MASSFAIQRKDNQNVRLPGTSYNFNEMTSMSGSASTSSKWAMTDDLLNSLDTELNTLKRSVSFDSYPVGSTAGTIPRPPLPPSSNPIKSSVSLSELLLKESVVMGYCDCLILSGPFSTSASTSTWSTVLAVLEQQEGGIYLFKCPPQSWTDMSVASITKLAFANIRVDGHFVSLMEESSMQSQEWRLCGLSIRMPGKGNMDEPAKRWATVLMEIILECKAKLTKANRAFKRESLTIQPTMARYPEANNNHGGQPYQVVPRQDLMHNSQNAIGHQQHHTLPFTSQSQQFHPHLQQPQQQQSYCMNHNNPQIAPISPAAGIIQHQNPYYPDSGGPMPVQLVSPAATTPVTPVYNTNMPPPQIPLPAQQPAPPPAAMMPPPGAPVVIPIGPTRLGRPQPTLPGGGAPIPSATQAVPPSSSSVLGQSLHQPVVVNPPFPVVGSGSSVPIMAPGEDRRPSQGSLEKVGGATAIYYQTPGSLPRPGKASKEKDLRDEDEGEGDSDDDKSQYHHYMAAFKARRENLMSAAALAAQKQAEVDSRLIQNMSQQQQQQSVPATPPLAQHSPASIYSAPMMMMQAPHSTATSSSPFVNQPLPHFNAILQQMPAIQQQQPQLSQQKQYMQYQTQQQPQQSQQPPFQQPPPVRSSAENAPPPLLLLENKNSRDMLRGTASLDERRRAGSSTPSKRSKGGQNHHHHHHNSNHNSNSHSNKKQSDAQVINSLEQMGLI